MNTYVTYKRLNSNFFSSKYTKKKIAIMFKIENIKKRNNAKTIYEFNDKASAVQKKL